MIFKTYEINSLILIIEFILYFSFSFLLILIFFSSLSNNTKIETILDFSFLIISIACFIDSPDVTTSSKIIIFLFFIFSPIKNPFSPCFFCSFLLKQYGIFKLYLFFRAMEVATTIGIPLYAEPNNTSN